jgi:hypothetical protein
MNLSVAAFLAASFTDEFTQASIAFFLCWASVNPDVGGVAGGVGGCAA